MSNILIFLAFSASAVAWFVIKWVTERQRPLPADIPYVKFEDGDDSYQRYFDNTRAVAVAGYNKVRYSQSRTFELNVDCLPQYSTLRREKHSPCIMPQTRIFHY